MEIFQIVVTMVGLLYQWRNLKEVWLDFRQYFPNRYPLLNLCWTRRWYADRTIEQKTAHANLVSELMKSGAQLALLIFGVWTLTEAPPPPYRVSEILAQAEHFGKALLAKEAVIILVSIWLMAHSMHERRARKAIEDMPFRRRETDAPLPQVTP